MIYVAIGIIGATVMPHNLYLHSALVQSRKLEKDDKSIRRAIRFNTIDSTVALTIAFFVNAAIVVLAAIVFFGKESVTVPGGQVVPFSPDSDWIRVAYLTLAPLLGTAAASTLFAVALFASGQSSTITGTLAGQVVMEGFMHWRISPWVRRLITRTLAILPAILVIGLRGQSSVTDLLDPQPGGAGHAAPAGHVPALALYQFPQENGRVEAGLVPDRSPAGAAPGDYGHGRLWTPRSPPTGVASHPRRMTACAKRREPPMYQKILVTLDATATDRAIIEHIKKLAKLLDSRVVLLHVATGAVAQWRGADAGGEEVAQGQAYLDQVKAEFEGRRHPGSGGTGLWRRGQGNHPLGRGERLRPGGDEHARPSLAGRPGFRDHRLRSAAHLTVPVLLLKAK